MFGGYQSGKLCHCPLSFLRLDLVQELPIHVFLQPHLLFLHENPLHTISHPSPQSIIDKYAPYVVVSISPRSCMLGAGSIDWYLIQFLATFQTFSLFISGSIFCTKYRVLSTPMWCIPCNSSNSLIPRLHVGTSFSSLTNHFLFSYVSTSALFFSLLSFWFQIQLLLVSVFLVSTLLSFLQNLWFVFFCSPPQ